MSGNRAGRRSSRVWEHFELVPTGDKVRCLHCNGCYCYDNHSASTGNLTKHLKCSHTHIYESMVKTQSGDPKISRTNKVKAVETFNPTRPMPQVQVTTLDEEPSPSTTPSNGDHPSCPVSPSMRSSPSPPMSSEIVMSTSQQRPEGSGRKRRRMNDVDSASEADSSEVDHFCKFMLVKLKSLDERTRSEAMVHIHQFLHRLTLSADK